MAFDMIEAMQMIAREKNIEFDAVLETLQASLLAAAKKKFDFTDNISFKFDRKTNEVIGIVVRGDNQDFRWTGKGWLSIIYPNPDIHSKEPQCTRVSEFKNIVDKLQ